MIAYRFGLEQIARPNLHGGHRLPLEDFRRPEQRSPVRSADANGVPPQSGGADQEPSAVRDHRVNVFTVHAPIIDQEHGECLSSKRSIP